jgi:DNA-directed RNA polymerase specialized sigma24 family protein
MKTPPEGYSIEELMALARTVQPVPPPPPGVDPRQLPGFPSRPVIYESAEDDALADHIRRISRALAALPDDQKREELVEKVEALSAAMQ